MNGRVSVLMTVLALTSLTLGGCTSTQDVLGTATNGLDGDVVRKTGTYPNIGGPLEAAGEQLSDEQTANMKAELGALAAESRGGDASEAAYKRRMKLMRELARKHGEDAAAEIEK